ncbi:MAG: helix-turn-helix domain-containing protein [Alistipes sp.]|nr:helix-turn-helix domain-containing protein [Alistipes sp.]
MDNILSSTLQKYIDHFPESRTYSIDDKLIIIDNPQFAVLPNHPYRCPLSVAIYCTRGKGIGRINTNTFSLTAGGFMIILPNQITELVDISDDFCATYIIMTDSFTEQLGIGNTFSLHTTISQHPHTNLTGRAKDALEGYLSMCKSIIPEWRNPNRLEIVTLLTRAFFLGLGYFLHLTESTESNRQSEITAEFIRLVEQNYINHRDLKFYAEQLSLTPKHISLVVKQSSGKSATEWIEKYVTLDAISQLTSTDKSIKAIAYDLGFPSQSFFGKYFCRVVGTSPAEYRKAHKK